jgi:hypothetical protein
MTGEPGGGVSAGPYKYLTQWNFKMNTTILDEPFLTEDAARARYDAHADAFSVVADVPGIGEGEVVPEFIIDVLVAAPDFKVTFLHPSGAFRRVSVFRNTDGRLFAWTVTDYIYEGEPRKGEHVAILNGVFEPDGTGKVIFRSTRTREQEVREFRDVPVGDRWLDVPAFGDWAPLLVEDEAAAPTL